MSIAAIIPAAGRGDRLGPGVVKALRELAGQPLLVHAVQTLRSVSAVGPIIVAAPVGLVRDMAVLLGPYDVLVVPGGPERQDSVRLALTALPAAVDLVLVHDAARPLTPAALVEDVIAALRGGATAVVPVLPVVDTVKRVAGDQVVATVDRTDLRAVQTPQGFARAVLVRAHGGTSVTATDDAALVERLGHTVSTIPGREEAFKVTRPYDLLIAEAVLRARR